MKEQKPSVAGCPCENARAEPTADDDWPDAMSPSPSELNAQLNGVVLQRMEVTPGLIILRVAPDDWQCGEFRPGQFAVLGLPTSAPRCAHSDPEEEEGEETPKPNKMLKRAYSIASSSVYREYLEFYIVLVPSGNLTPRLFTLGPGERLWLGTKFSGIFTLDQVPEDQHVVLIATGTGLAPYLSMVRSELVCGGPRRFAILHGARHSWDLGYRSELETLDHICSNLSYIPSISRPAEEPRPWQGLSGYIQDVWKGKPLDQLWDLAPTPTNTHVFVCGNPEMVESMLEILATEGFREHTKQTPGQVHLERYW